MSQVLTLGRICADADLRLCDRMGEPREPRRGRAKPRRTWCVCVKHKDSGHVWFRTVPNGAPWNVRSEVRAVGRTAWDASKRVSCAISTTGICNDGMQQAGGFHNANVLFIIIWMVVHLFIRLPSCSYSFIHRTALPARRTARLRSCPLSSRCSAGHGLGFCATPCSASRPTECRE